MSNQLQFHRDSGWKRVEEEIRDQLKMLVETHPVLRHLPAKFRDEIAYRGTVAITRAPTWTQIVYILARSRKEPRHEDG